MGAKCSSSAAESSISSSNERGFREIFATQNVVDGHETVRVYQAYNESIAHAAAEANSFTAPRDQVTQNAN